MENFFEVLTAWTGIFFGDLRDFIKSITWQMTANLLMFSMMIMFVNWARNQSKDKNSKISLDDILIDPRTGRIGGSTMRLNIFFFVSMVTLIISVMNKDPNIVAELTTLGLLWVGDKAVSRFTNKSTPTSTVTPPTVPPNQPEL